MMQSRPAHHDLTTFKLLFHLKENIPTPKMNHKWSKLLIQKAVNHQQIYPAALRLNYDH